MKGALFCMINISNLFPFRYGIFLKLLTTFLMVCIPIYLIGTLMSKSGVDIIRQQVLVLMKQKSDYFVSSMESELKNVLQLQENFLKDSDLQMISIRSDTLRPYEKTKTINDLHSKLMTLAASSRYIKEAFVLMPNLERRLSSVSGHTEMDPQELNDFLSRRPARSGIVALDDRLFIPMGFPYLTNSQFLLVIELSVDKISKDLADMNEQGTGVSYLMSNGNTDRFLIPSIDVPAGNSLLITHTTGIDSSLFKLDGISYLRFAKPFLVSGWTLVTIAEEDEMLKPVHAFKKWSTMLYIISILVIVFVSYLLLRFIHKPLRKLMQAFKKVEIGQFDINLQHRNKDEFHYLYNQFNQMTARLKFLVQQVYEQMIRSQRAELKQLQSQVNPHFLYNSLYILYRMAQEEDFEGVSAMSKHLGEYFKFITQNKDDFVSLEKELQHAKVYASIQQIRFGSRISIQFDEQGSLQSWEVPRLIVQPFLENAIVHGLEDVYEGKIHVRVEANPGSLTIEIEDNGKGAPTELLRKWEEAGGLEHEFGDHALWNVHRRLQLRYGKGSGIRLRTNPLGGLTAALILTTEGAVTYE